MNEKGGRPNVKYLAVFVCAVITVSAVYAATPYSSFNTEGGDWVLHGNLAEVSGTTPINPPPGTVYATFMVGGPGSASRVCAGPNTPPCQTVVCTTPELREACWNGIIGGCYDASGHYEMIGPVVDTFTLISESPCQ